MRTCQPGVTESGGLQLVTAAHYVAQRTPNVEFHFMGYGPLARHLKNMVSALNLESTVIVKETIHVAEIQNLDLFLYLPIRNDHFGPVLYASHYGLPVIANELPGIDDIIVEGKTGFIVPPHDTKALGELILRMETNRELKEGLGAALRSHLDDQFPISMAIDQISRIFGLSETTIKAILLAS